MNHMPGFTAETALLKTNRQYQGMMTQVCSHMGTGIIAQHSASWDAADAIRKAVHNQGSIYCYWGDCIQRGLCMRSDGIVDENCCTAREEICTWWPV